jgi:RHS repeat-associated protein
MHAPQITLPKGGGAIRGIGEKFGANPVTGTGAMSVPIATSTGRSGFGPQLSLSYDSGQGNGPFGLGWNLALASITRKTDKGLPRYDDGAESDVFILSGAEDLVPVLTEVGGQWVRYVEPRTLNGVACTVHRYRPRIEGLFARIERWTSVSDPREVCWRAISGDNITTWYGKSAGSRIADPADPGRIFSWLICESYDDKGNAILYQYKQEDSAGVDIATQPYERNRTPAARSAGWYLKRVKYGNRTPRRADEDLAKRDDWLFEVVFDYGEHYAQGADGQSASVVLDDQGRAWARREDPFSTYRAGFEVRTSRLCQRVLMFHHFPDELGAADCLVCSADIAYSTTAVASLLTQVATSGYVRRADGSYLKKSLPPTDFEYSAATVDGEVRDVDAASLENLPGGAAAYQWLDLDGEGLPGVLAQQGDAWFFKRNVSPLTLSSTAGGVTSTAQFDPVIEEASLPSVAGAPARLHQFLDLAGDGRLDCVTLEGPAPGFFERTGEQDWDAFTPLPSLPNLDWGEPNLRFADLTGDGLADIAITQEDVLTWYPSLAEDGFGPAIRVPRSRDEEDGPAVIFADVDQTIFVADMSGDGLADIVRIRNGEVCFWPNLGYGRFGAKVAMDNAPWLDAPDLFEPRRVRLADIDGSGTTDIIYLAASGVRLYFNQSGNGWSDAQALPAFPPVDDVSDIQALDLLGNGTACLVWSSPLPGDARAAMRYVDLMGGQKPHLLVKTANNLGAETRIEYAPSTKFYLTDRRAGRPWITRLPFPVHVVERVETTDRVSGNRFVTRSAYHHGYFDGAEREFRGFGMVEHWDTEEFAALAAGGQLGPATNVDATSHVPPVLTRSWFHTGVFDDRRRVSNYFAGLDDGDDHGEYFREPGLTGEDVRRLLLDDTILPAGLTAGEERQACRALKGSMLRQEVYALDGTDKAPFPYSVTEHNFTLECLQPQDENRYAVFFPHARESVVYHYERNPADPRIAHSLTLAVDGFGNVLESAAVVYPRRQPDATLQARDQANQGQLHATYSQSSVTNAIDAPDDYRVPLSCESQTFDLTGLALSPGSARLPLDQVAAAASGAQTIPYQHSATDGVAQKRLIDHARALYRADDLSGALPLGHLEPRAIPFQGLKLALTPDLVAQVYGAKMPGTLLGDEGGYVHSEGDDLWWIPSGEVFLSPGANDDAPAELAYAGQHFFLPHRYRDPFGHVTVAAYDAYDLLTQEVSDALGNTVTAGERDPAGNLLSAGNDYRVLAPRLVTDPNGNRAAASFDALGLVVGTAVMGKPDPAARQGDLLDGFEPDLPDDVIAAHLADPLSDPHAILGRATTRLVYDPFAYSRTQGQDKPAATVVYTLVRETHDADLGAGEQAQVQHHFAYSDGFGRSIQRKSQAEGGPVVSGGPVVGRRWVATGWTIFDNKGNPVRKFEPFFSTTFAFESDVRAGVSPVICYDPAGRAVATLHPNHAWEKVVLGPWRQESWDVNDTALIADPGADADVGDFFRRLDDAEYLPTWLAQRQPGSLGAEEQDAAAKTAIHAATPLVTHADTLGRTFLTVTQNRFVRDGATIEESYATRVQLDIEGNERAVTDANDRVVMTYDYDMLGTRLHQASMEAGERWTLTDVAGKLVHAWDSRGHEFRTTYDALRRPLEGYLRDGAGSPVLIGQSSYGESHPEASARNLRGRPFQVFDQAGLITTDTYDFKGNLLSSSRQLARAYRDTFDWRANPDLEPSPFAGSTTYDALNRPTSITTADASTYLPVFNEANLLERVQVRLGGSPAATTFVANIDYDAKGQRLTVGYGNGARTDYAYDPLTFRLTGLTTSRSADQAVLQELHYTYDPAGNITHISDAAQQTIYFSNQVVTPDGDYTYDAVYRLIGATGREHIGQVTQPQTSWDDGFRVHLPAPTDGQAMRPYAERYDYDAVGNVLQLIHQASAGNWTRRYAYDAPSLLDPAKTSNRLTATTVGTGTPDTYTYDAHGNMTSMPHLPGMAWDHRDQLQATTKQAVTETTYYVYDAGGQRVRKVTERQNGTRKGERIYIGGFEVYREYDGTGTTVTLERETLHVMDDKQRIALVETRTVGNDGSESPLIRYQFSNHLGSSSLELDDAGRIISYEEYYAYGSTSYQAVRDATEVAAKRFRFTGKERDEESGLNYHSTRYLAVWLGRWASADPRGLTDGPNVYAYASGNPVKLIDSTGTNGHSPSFEEFKKTKEWRDYVQAARDAKRADEKLAAFLKTDEGSAAAAAEARLSAAKSALATLTAQQADLKKRLDSAEQDFADKSVVALQAAVRAHDAKCAAGPYLRDCFIEVVNPLRAAAIGAAADAQEAGFTASQLSWEVTSYAGAWEAPPVGPSEPEIAIGAKVRTPRGGTRYGRQWSTEEEGGGQFDCVAATCGRSLRVGAVVNADEALANAGLNQRLVSSTRGINLSAVEDLFVANGKTLGNALHGLPIEKGDYAAVIYRRGVAEHMVYARQTAAGSLYIDDAQIGVRYLGPSAMQYLQRQTKVVFFPITDLPSNKSDLD